MLSASQTPKAPVSSTLTVCQSFWAVTPQRHKRVIGYTNHIRHMVTSSRTWHPSTTSWAFQRVSAIPEDTGHPINAGLEERFLESSDSQPVRRGPSGGMNDLLIGVIQDHLKTWVFIL